MPRTPPTIVAPLPRDHRVLLLAKALNVSRAEAYTAVADVWAALAAEASGDIVKKWALEDLDAVVDLPAGFGTEMFRAGLVGVVDQGLVLPAELRRADKTKGPSAARSCSSGAERQRRYRDRKRLSVPVAKRAAAAPSVASSQPKPNPPSRLGSADGFPVMLLWSRAGVPFYKLAGASPREWTGTVTDPDNPSFADALVALHATMKREAGKGLGSGDNFRPSLQAIVAEAERYRNKRASAAADDARRDEGNKALAEASAEDQDDIDHEPAERNESVTGDARYVTPVTGDALSDVARYAAAGATPSGEGTSDDSQRDVERYGVPPSSSNSLSSSSSSSSGNEDMKDTTTTSVVTPRKRDHEDDILDRFVPRKDPVVDERERKRQELAGRFAAALGGTVESILQQWRRQPDILRARVEAAGIDPNTGLPVNAEGAHEPRGARDGIGVNTDVIDQDKPAAGSVGARHGAEFDCDHQQIHQALRQLGIPSPATPAPPHEDDAFERQRADMVNRLVAGV